MHGMPFGYEFGVGYRSGGKLFNGVSRGSPKRFSSKFTLPE
jgi:hypothetical protein